MTAGLEWNEWTLPYSDPRNDAVRLLMAEDPVAFTLGRPVRNPPGSHWLYNSGLTELLVEVIEQKTGKRLREFATEVLFEPLGINNFEWWGGWDWKSKGRPNAAAGLRMRARDLAKIDSLVLHDGVWDNQRVVSSEWIQLSIQRHVMESRQDARGVYGYGFQWWPGHSNSIPAYKIIAGFGLGGQQLLVVPELHLVVTVLQGTMTATARICLTGYWTALRSLIENMVRESPITHYQGAADQTYSHERPLHQHCG